MTENEVVGDPTPDGASGNQPPVSQGNGQPIPSAPTPQDFVSKKDLENVVKELRGLQSRQDKSTDEQTRFMNELRTKMSQGLSLDQAEKAVNDEAKARLKDDLLFQMAEKLGVQTPFSQQAPAGNGSPVTVDKAKTLSEYGLSENDPDVAVALSGREFKSEMELENIAGKILAKRTNKPQPDISNAPSVQGEIPRPAGVEELTRKYQNDMLAARGNRNLLTQIKAKAIKDGVPVDTVVFV